MKTKPSTRKQEDGVRRGTLRRLLVADLVAFLVFFTALLAVLHFLGLLDTIFNYIF